MRILIIGEGNLGPLPTSIQRIAADSPDQTREAFVHYHFDAVVYFVGPVKHGIPPKVQERTILVGVPESEKDEFRRRGFLETFCTPEEVPGMLSKVLGIQAA